MGQEAVEAHPGFEGGKHLPSPAAAAQAAIEYRQSAMAVTPQVGQAASQPAQAVG
jgi:hypothetical protein